MCNRTLVYGAESDFLLFSCIVYFTNYYRVCIFVNLLTINFVRVLIVYFQNIVYSCITINFHCQLRKNYTYLLHSMHVQLQYILLLLYKNLHVPVLFIQHFLNASTDTNF